jgi:dipeptidyl-peptidase-4
MITRSASPGYVCIAAAFLFISVILAPFANAQDRLKFMPGYDRYEKMRKEIPDSVKLGSLSVRWTEGGKAFEYQRDGKRYRYDVAERRVTELPAPSGKAAPQADTKNAGGKRGRGGQSAPVARGRQATSAISPDGKYKAFYRDRNLWMSSFDGSNETAITTDGNDKGRVKYGTASWVYGEELDQVTAMWWSPDSSKIAFYRFDESRVPDYFLQMEQVRLLSTVDVEPYVKAGGTNPIVDILIHDLASKKTLRVDVRDGKPSDDAVVGHYVYKVSWSRDGRELLFNRSNRLQNVVEFTACDPASGGCRVIVREEWPASWVESSPGIQFLEDGRRFIWTSERTGWKNFYLYDLSGKLLTTLSAHPFEVDSIVRVDERAGLFYYMARSGDNPMKLQLHRVSLDGTGEKRLTDPALHHRVDIAPDRRHFIDVAQTHALPPTTSLRDADGVLVADVAESNMAKFKKLGLNPVEMFKFKASDGVTDLYGMLHRPSNFSPRKKYPLLVSVYAGPATSGARENFVQPSALAEFGFLVASFDSRSANGRGKKFLDAIYRKLGTVEIDDQAAGVRSLLTRPYVDKDRVGIYGTSYGGFASAMCLVRHPDLFQAACASSAVTDFRNYDSTYTERYMGLPQENAAGYDATAIKNLVTNLNGRLMIYYGTADDNVHPNNAMQLIQALDRAGKSFEVQVGPDRGHSSIRQERMMEFFIENLVFK